MRTMIWVVGLTLTLGAQGPSGVPEVSESRMLVLVMPRDGWRLTVIRSGAARINYAALPQAVWSPRGTMSFPGFHANLKDRVLAEPCAGDEVGRVEFVTAGTTETPTVWCMPDEAFAMERFEHVWARVPEVTDAVGREHLEFLRSMWERRDAPRERRP